MRKGLKNKPWMGSVKQMVFYPRWWTYFYRYREVIELEGVAGLWWAHDPAKIVIIERNENLVPWLEENLTGKCKVFLYTRFGYQWVEYQGSGVYGGKSIASELSSRQMGRFSFSSSADAVKFALMFGGNTIEA